jgi:hypothetical protein
MASRTCLWFPPPAIDSNRALEKIMLADSWIGKQEDILATTILPRRDEVERSVEDIWSLFAVRGHYVSLYSKRREANQGKW